MSESFSDKTVRASFKQGTLNLRIASHRALPLVVLLAGQPDPTDLLAICRRHGTPAFNLLSISNIRWDEDLSPWPSKPLIMADDHFTGEAASFLSWIEQTALLWALSQLPEPPVTTILIGYSMGGLFATYAALSNAPFEGYASVSGSLWYPDFAKWACNQKLSRLPEAIYFSLGNTETKTSNPVLQTTGICTEQIEHCFAAQKVPTVFEWNPGNHFQNPPARLARALHWLLHTL